MKRLLRISAVSVLAACVLLLSVFGVSAASVGSVTVSIPDKVVSANETFNLDVTLTENTGLTCLRLFVKYDATLLTLTNAVDKGVLNGANFSDDNYASPYKLVWLDALATQNNTATGVIATLTFKANANVPETTDTAVEVYLEAENDALDCNMGKLALVYSNNTITVEASDYLIGDVDNDGVVSADDAVFVLYHFLEYEGYEITQDCDFNGDGTVTDGDAVYLLYNVHFGDTLYPLS